MDSAAPLITASAAELREALPDGGVLLGLDLGTKTIGTALSDAGWRFAAPLSTVPYRMVDSHAAAVILQAALDALVGSAF